MKAIFSYIVVFVAAIGYMLLFDKAVGGIMAVFIFVTPIISLILTLAAKNKISFSVEADKTNLKKGKAEKIFISISKNIFLPVPIVSFSVKLSERFAPLEHDVYRFSMSENKKLVVGIDIVPEICGVAEISICNIFISDYLGIFRFRIISDIPVYKTMSIDPEIVEIDEGSELLRNIFNNLIDNDSEETSASNIGKSSFPGYEYRNYIPGDSLKRINWKLSSKKNQLYVRTDEVSSITMPDIILDISSPENAGNSRTALLMEEKIIESSLSLLFMCLKSGIECTYSYSSGIVQKKAEITSREELEKLANDVCQIRFESASVGEHVNLSAYEENSKTSGVSVVYTLNFKRQLIDKIRKNVLDGNYVKLVVPECIAYSQRVDMSDLWVIKDDYSICRYG